MATIFITGANRGIGLELTRQLTHRGERVIAACRKSSPELEELGYRARIEVDVDVTSDASIKQLGARIGEPLDVIIHNAGLLERHGLDSAVLESIRRQFEVNALGPLRVTAALMRNLRENISKIAIITSRMGSIADNGSGGYYGYRMSKAALNMAGVTLARDLRPRGIAVGMFHPGYVRTAMTGFKGDLDATTSAALLIQRIDELSLAGSGGFWHANGERLPW